MKHIASLLFLCFSVASLLVSGCLSTKEQNTPVFIDNKTIKIATWNIENFGLKKSEDPIVMRMIAGKLSRYDLIAIQEVSSLYEQSDPGCPRNEKACPSNNNCFRLKFTLEKYLNKDLNMDYGFVFSPYVKDERYLFVYNKKTVEYIGSELAVDIFDNGPPCMNDSDGLLARQPFIGNFKSRNMKFTLFTAHTSPDNTYMELQRLETMISEYVNSTGEQNIILAGDLNADCDYVPKNTIYLSHNPYLGRLWQNPYIVEPPDGTDTTTGKTTCTYDRIIFTNTLDSRFSGTVGTDDTYEYVSDHKLVWIEFYNG